MLAYLKNYCHLNTAVVSSLHLILVNTRVLVPLYDYTSLKLN